MNEGRLDRLAPTPCLQPLLNELPENRPGLCQREAFHNVPGLNSYKHNLFLPFCCSSSKPILKSVTENSLTRSLQNLRRRVISMVINVNILDLTLPAREALLILRGSSYFWPNCISVVKQRLQTLNLKICFQSRRCLVNLAGAHDVHRSARVVLSLQTA